MKQRYKKINFRPERRGLIAYVDQMCKEYRAQGFMLSVRQLYYQLVARGMVENTERSYQNVASMINDGRLAGLIDWDAIEDRGRDIEVRSHWENGREILSAVAKQFYMDHWVGQSYRVFVIVEKAALAGVLGGVCHEYDVPLLAARGYPSVSVVRDLVQTHILPSLAANQTPIILHLGDHDPSGIDMTRDLQERIELFVDGNDWDMDWKVSRIALTMAQIEEKKPPPNPAKVTDSRFADYQRKFGDESWELDAIEPADLVDLVTGHIEEHIGQFEWDKREAEIEHIKSALEYTASTFRP